MQAKHVAHLLGFAQPEPAQPAPLFHPIKDLLDPAASMDRFGVALVAGVATVDR
jgi:hypothetical protein